MAIPLPVYSRDRKPRLTMDSRSPTSPSQFRMVSPFPASSIAMSPQYGNSCALTIIKGDADHPITAHEPIHKKHNASRGPLSRSPSSRFAAPFFALRSAVNSASSGFDSSVNVHTVSDHGILLPFLERPAEVRELLFETKANETLMRSLCSVFGGDMARPLQRGKDERWDEMLELLIELDRPLLDDEDWLARLGSLIMERSPSLWAQLARCLGADSLPVRPAAQLNSSRFDSWALPSSYTDASHDNESPLPTPSAVSSEDDHDAHSDRALFLNVEPLAALPQAFSEQPAAKMQQSSLHESASSAASSSYLSPAPAEGSAHVKSGSQVSQGEVFAMSADKEDTSLISALEDIVEEHPPSEPGSGSNRSRARSHSGKFAGLRISALSPSSPPTFRRASSASTLNTTKRTDAPASPLPTGAMSPVSLAPQSPIVACPNATSTSFSKHRRLSIMMVHNQPSHRHQSHAHDRDTFDLDNAPSPMATSPRRQRGFSDAQHHAPGTQSQRRRRAESFARSFAELRSPSEHIEKLRADYAKSEADRLAEGARGIIPQDVHDPFVAPALAASASGLGLHANSDPPEPASAASRAGERPRRLSRPRNHVRSVDRISAASDAGSDSPPMPGLLPDGRTRHPSGSYGSRDLSETIAAFRANMGLSTSPSASAPSSPEVGDGPSDAGKSSESVIRKRRGTSAAQLPGPTSRTSDTLEANIFGRGSTASAEEEHAKFSKPKHMEEVENRNQGSRTGGSGLALGGGFSLARSGANFRRRSHDSADLPQTSWRSSFAQRDATCGRGQESYSPRSPPTVQRRPGGFTALAQEYDRARQGRRSSEVGFSINSNAVASSPASSLASFDVGVGIEGSRPSEEDTRLELPPTKEEEPGGSEKDVESPDAKGEPTPKAGLGGGVTPRASFGQQSYPFPNLLHRPATSTTQDDTKVDITTPGRELAAATPLSPPQACHTRLASSPGAASSNSRSISIVFPISPNPSISRARELQKIVDTRRCQLAFDRIRQVCGTETVTSIRELITTSERSHLHDEELLEEVAHRLGLVDHEEAHRVGGAQAEAADLLLAEEGYETRWEVFRELCGSLGVGQYGVGMAMRRCGPAILLCR